MNLHLFLDVVAFSWGTMLTLRFVLATIMRGKGHKHASTRTEWTVIFMLATLCWAWIIAS